MATQDSIKSTRADERGPSHSQTDEGMKLLQAQILLNVSKTVAAFETLDEMLAALVDMTTDAVGADRGTIFLNDCETGELYSRVAHGNLQREIRILNNRGVAGHVFTTGKGTIVHDAYGDEHFDRSVDEQTGYQTKNILCVPIRTVRGDIIGVAQALNNKRGRFTEKDLALLEAMTTQAAVALQSTQLVEQLRKSSLQEMEFFDVISDVTSEIDLGAILGKVMSQATKMLNAERSTFFLNDEKTNDLFSKIGEGLGVTEIRLPNHLGIAGTVFTSGETVNIPYAYADLRFNPAFDKKTGFFTRSILCVPVINKTGKTIGVTQVLNKRGTYRSREIDRVVVKGKREPVDVYEILDYHNDETFPNLMEAVNNFKNGLTQYRAGKWAKAIGAFKETLSLNPKDKLSQIYIERCEHLKEDPPGDGWDGVWIMTSK